MVIICAVGNDGTITLLKSIREKAHLESGGRVAIDMDEEGHVVIKRVDDVKMVRGPWKVKEEIIDAINSLKKYRDAGKTCKSVLIDTDRSINYLRKLPYDSIVNV